MAVPHQPEGEDDLVELVLAFRKAPDTQAFWPLAQARLAAGRLPAAIDVLRHGIGLFPQHTQARLALARALLARSDWSEASAELLLVTATDPQHAEAHVLLGEALDGAGDPDGAKVAFERACALAPDDELAAFLLEQKMTASRRALAKVALGRKRTTSAVIEERRRRADARGAEEDSPSKPPPQKFLPEDPLAPLPETPSDVPRGSRPLLPMNLARGSVVPSRTAQRPPYRPRPPQRMGLAVAIVLFLIVAAGGGGVAFNYLRDQPGAAAPAAPPPWMVAPEVAKRLALGRPEDYRFAAEKVATAPAGTPAALAVVAESRALALFEYGEGDPAVAEAAAAAAARADPRSESPAVAVAQAALALGRLSVGAETEEVAAVAPVVERAATLGGHGIASSLQGLRFLAAGDRESARGAFAIGEGTSQATMALADMAFDEGDLDGALAGYEAVLARAPGHPFALVGRAAVALERGGSPDPALADLALAAKASDGHRLSAWIALLSSRAKGSEAPDATDPGSDRRLAREQALLRADRGAVADAARLRARLGDADPVFLAPLDAALALGRGLPEEALTMLGKRTDVRSRRLRGLALLDLNRLQDAEEELRAARSAGGDDGVVALHTLAQLRAGKNRKPALATLELVATSAPAGLPGLALGEARLAAGDADAARKAFTAVSPDGPWSARANVRLAELDLVAFDRTHDARRLTDADAEVHKALEQAPEYLPARAIVGRLLVLMGQPEGALAAFGPVIAASRDSAADDLALAEAYISGGDRDRAKDALRRAVHKGAPLSIARALAARIDRRFVDELGR